MTAPLKVPLTIYQGATFRKTVTWKAGPTETPVNLTGCSARMQIRERIEASDVLLELTTANGRVILGGTAGTVTIELSSAVTEAITWRAGVYDLEIEYANGDVRRLLNGSVKVVPEVTRD